MVQEQQALQPKLARPPDQEMKAQWYTAYLLRMVKRMILHDAVSPSYCAALQTTWQQDCEHRESSADLVKFGKILERHLRTCTKDEWQKFEETTIQELRLPDQFILYIAKCCVREKALQEVSAPQNLAASFLTLP